MSKSKLIEIGTLVAPKKYIADSDFINIGIVVAYTCLEEPTPFNVIKWFARDKHGESINGDGGYYSTNLKIIK
jgi:hypothetical protein